MKQAKKTDYPGSVADLKLGEISNWFFFYDKSSKVAQKVQ